MFKGGKSEENVIKSKDSNNGSDQDTKNYVRIFHHQIINGDSRKERQASHRGRFIQKLPEVLPFLLGKCFDVFIEKLLFLLSFQ